jgi:hypothetical protein
MKFRGGKKKAKVKIFFKKTKIIQEKNTGFFEKLFLLYFSCYGKKYDKPKAGKKSRKLKFCLKSNRNENVSVLA